MTKEQLEHLHNLSNQEKFEVAQMLWDDIAKDQSSQALPEQHKKILDERISNLTSGATRFKNWERIKEKYYRG